jgi:hypothetical protein
MQSNLHNLKMTCSEQLKNDLLAYAPHLVQTDVSDWLRSEADDLYVLFERDMRQDP